MQKLSKNTSDLLYLIGCALDKKDPEPRNYNFEYLFKLAKKSNVVSMIYPAINGKFDLSLDWAFSYKTGIRRCMLMDAERQSLYDFMYKNKIWHTDLKGIVMQDLYPEYGMRLYGDNDILFDKYYEDIVDKYMLERGYKVTRSLRHNQYLKPPIFNFELHKTLFNEAPYKKIYDYFCDKQFLNNEDFYLHLICHRYKDYNVAGTGLKNLCDLYVYMKKYNLDFGYIEKACEAMDIADFELQSRNLAINALSNQAKLSFQDVEELEKIVAHGEYGDLDNYVASKLDQYCKTPGDFRAYFFPSLDSMQKRGFSYAKHKALVPLYWARMYVNAGKTFGLKNLGSSFYHNLANKK